MTQMTNPMLPELLRYYQDEMDSWNRVLELHREESSDLVRKLTLLFEQQSSYREIGTGIIDLLMLQQQKTQHLKGFLDTQQLQFDHLMDSSDDFHWQSLSEAQEALRTKMRSAERDFNRTKYESAFFLFSSLKEVLLVARSGSTTKPDEKKS